MKAVQHVTQRLEDIDPKVLKSARESLYSQPGKDAAFFSWRLKLGKNDTLPRGRFFRKRQTPHPLIIFDEGWMIKTKMN